MPQSESQPVSVFQSINHLFAIDIRSLAALRIAIAFASLYYLIELLPDTNEFSNGFRRFDASGIKNNFEFGDQCLLVAVLVGRID